MPVGGTCFRIAVVSLYCKGTYTQGMIYQTHLKNTSHAPTSFPKGSYTSRVMEILTQTTLFFLPVGKERK